MSTSAFIAFLTVALLASTSHGKFGKKQYIDRNIISVTGAGRRTYKTSIAVVRLGVRVNGKSALAVQLKIAARSTKLTNYLRSQQVNKLQTSGVSLFPMYNYGVRPAVITGYSGTNTVSFEVHVGRAGKILDGAVQNGASQISGVSFKGTPFVLATARRKAIVDAVRHAHREAATAVFALGKKLGHPVRVKITDSFVPQARSSDASASRAFRVETAQTSQIIANEQIVSAFVAITYFMI